MLHLDMRRTSKTVFVMLPSSELYLDTDGAPLFWKSCGCQMIGIIKKGIQCYERKCLCLEGMGNLLWRQRLQEWNRSFFFIFFGKRCKLFGQKVVKLWEKICLSFVWKFKHLHYTKLCKFFVQFHQSAIYLPTLKTIF